MHLAHGKAPVARSITSLLTSCLVRGTDATHAARPLGVLRSTTAQTFCGDGIGNRFATCPARPSPLICSTFLERRHLATEPGRANGKRWEMRLTFLRPNAHTD